MPMTATTYEAIPNRSRSARSHRAAQLRHMIWVVPVARFCFSLIFILAGMGHFSTPMIQMAASQGVPMANILVPLSGAMAIIGGLSVLFGYRTRWGALMLIAFLVPVTLLMHNYWSISDPMQKQMQMVHFLKNISMLGGAMFIAFYGAGPYSLDHRSLKH